MFETIPFDTSIIKPVDGDLCDLLGSMSLASGYKKEEFIDATPRLHQPTLDVRDEVMSDDSLSDTTSEYSNQSKPPTQSRNDKSTNETYGCTYLKVLQEQIAIEGYPTTGGDYLEAIFTHRELFTSYRGSHQDCARAFSDIAFSLERRAWRADRDADSEAVAAFRHEAWMIAAWIDKHHNEIRQAHDVLPLRSAPSIVCFMPL
ncbi:hypothetical protein E1B28_002433 [Marasmius oreades]|uniref:Uncharacterized protein n=1 Tax=Marasmius oreades TaxID=181124 RepID=A0A9P7RNK8_9AGAR|nr:uncharacterized protein E1B28_002433 [Marasmius oreades]KAG7086483.1 hypothetical protein E1B28_002433 [Marasmius oreades]